MQKYVGLDVSMEETSVCVLDGSGSIVYEGKTSSQPDALSKLLRAKASDVARIVLEIGALAYHSAGLGRLRFLHQLKLVRHSGELA